MELISSALQTVVAGGNVVFTNTAIPGSSCILHKEGSGVINLRGMTRQNRARFKVFFSGNLSLPPGGSPGTIQLAITENGEVIDSSVMMVTPAAVSEPFNVSKEIFIDVPCGCCVSVSVKNTSAVSVNVQNANLIVERVA